MSSLLDVAKNTANTVKESAIAVKTKTEQATIELMTRFADMLVAAAAVVAALSWNDAFKSLFIEGGVFHKFATGGPWVAAIVISIFAVALGYWRTRLVPASSTIVKK